MPLVLQRLKKRRKEQNQITETIWNKLCLYFIGASWLLISLPLSQLLWFIKLLVGGIKKRTVETIDHVRFKVGYIYS